MFCYKLCGTQNRCSKPLQGYWPPTRFAVLKTDSPETLQDGTSVLTTAHCVGGPYKFREFVLTIAKIVGSLYRFVQSVLSAGKSVGELQIVGYMYLKPVEVWRVRFNYCKMCRRPVDSQSQF